MRQLRHASAGRWIVPKWGKYELSEVRTVEVESWLRSLARARSTCAKIRNLMSVLFNHAWRYEFFDHNPIKLVRQSTKRRTTPSVLIPAETKLLLDNLEIRERTLVLLAVSTGLRQSELFALKWGNIDFSEVTMNVARSIAYGIVGRCKREASQKPVPVHPILAKALTQWRDRCRYRDVNDWVFANEHYRGRHPYWGQAILRTIIRPVAERVGIKKWMGWHTFRHTYSTLLRSVGAEFKSDAGVDASFVPAIHDRHLYSSGHAGKARRTSRRVVPTFPCRTTRQSSIAEQEGTPPPDCRVII